MFIETTDGAWPSDRKTVLIVGGIRYAVGQIARKELRDDVLAFAAGLAERRPFTPEFGCEPLFNVEFVGDAFMAYTWRPRSRGQWLWWLGSIKVASKPEKLDDALAYLNDYAASLKPV
jgi:hypothetical protein